MITFFAAQVGAGISIFLATSNPKNGFVNWLIPMGIWVFSIAVMYGEKEKKERDSRYKPLTTDDLTLNEMYQVISQGSIEDSGEGQGLMPTILRDRYDRIFTAYLKRKIETGTWFRVAEVGDSKVRTITTITVKT